MFLVCCLLVVVCYVFFASCLKYVAWCSVFDISVFAVRCLMFVVCWFAASCRWLLMVACCLLCVVFVGCYVFLDCCCFLLFLAVCC